jgi:hypothetical protein
MSEAGEARGLYHRYAALATAEDTGCTDRVLARRAAVLAELGGFGEISRQPGARPLATVPDTSLPADTS